MLNAHSSGRARTRQADIALAAGVSQATVSMVLSGRPSARIAKETKKRILELSGSLGYSANPAARRLAGGKNRMLGVFTYEPTFPIAGLDQYYPFLLGIESEAEELQQNLLLFTGASGKDRVRSIYAENVNQLGIADGSILLGRGEDRDEVARLASDGYPFVYIGRREVKNADISWVTADYEGATFDVATDLVRLGHRRYLYIGVPEPEEPNLDRYSGWQRAVEEHRLISSVERPRPDSDLPAMIQEHVNEGVTAIVVETPEDGSQMFRALKKLGLAVPQDVSVTVLGDMAIPRGWKQAWSGFGMPFGAIGIEAVRLLVEMISDPDAERQKIKLPCIPRPGKTVGEARAHN